MKPSEYRDFEQAILQAVEHFRGQGFRVRAAIIEKDYYVTEALRIPAATTAAHDSIVFKGGASSQKAGT